MSDRLTLGLVSTRTLKPPSAALGALVGAVTVLGFAVIHDIFIVDIWDSIRRMVIAGALCGLCLTWSYNKAVGHHSTGRWWAYIGSCAAVLVALGGVSFVVLDPRFTMAELIAADDALARLIPPVLPLMIVASLVGTLVVWVGFGRRWRAIIPILVTQVLLVFLVGHNLAILGVVEMSSDLLTVAWEFVGLTLFLAATFAAGVALVGWVRARAASPI